MGKEDFDTDSLLEIVRQHTRNDAFWARDLFRVAEQLLGHKLYANMMLLGLAQQRRLLPLSLGHLTTAMRATISAPEWDDNFRAFQLGRLLALDSEPPAELRRALEPVVVNPISASELIDDKSQILQRSACWGGRKLAGGYRQALAIAFEMMPVLDDSTQRSLALRFYDLILYRSLAYAQSAYLDKVVQTYRRDRSEYGYAATRAVIGYLYKVLAIKDEVWVSHLLTSEEKRRRDHDRYRIDPSRGDQLRYVHLNRPEFNFFRFKLQFRIRSRTWMLQILKRMKFLRGLPGWHVAESHFRDRYACLVDRFRYDCKGFYDELVGALELPERVRGYVEVRYPTMVDPLRRIEQLLQHPQLSGPQMDPPESSAVREPHFRSLGRTMARRSETKS